jgi:CRISPR-associated protein Cmr2
VRRLSRVTGGLGIPPPTRYLAVVVQDMDGMGRLLSGEPPSGLADPVEVTASWHRQCSAQLVRLGRAQAQAVAGRHVGCPVYAGGDDLLVFTPASTALAAAVDVRGLVDEHLDGYAEAPTASTAVLFFHMRSPLQQAIRGARRLLEAAKDARPAKDALAVAVHRRGGERAVSIQPWHLDPPGSVDPPGSAGPRRRAGSAGQFDRLRPGGVGGRLSPAFASTLERDRAELQALGGSGRVGADCLQAELRRVLARHGGTGEQARVLAGLARDELNGYGGGGWDPVPAAQVARFLHQECR